MAASRMSRISSWRLAFLWLAAAMTVASVSADSSAAENLEDVELITASRSGDEYVAISGAEGDTKVSASPSDLKKNSLNKKFQKFYPKTEADWNFKGEGKKTDVFIKDAKDYRLLRIISEGLLRPQDVLPLGSDDAIIPSQKHNGSNEEMNVNVQPEGMSGIVNDGIAVDSDEKIIMEKKKNGTIEASIKPENDSSVETEQNVKINLDASAGVQSPKFHKQRGSITVPEQKQISLSKVKESKNDKKAYESSGYDIIPLNKQREKHNTDEGVFDFVDSPLSDKHLVPAGSGKTSHVNVKKGPNGQEYEYEYIYYYYEDDEPDTNKSGAAKNPKGNEIPVSTSGPALRTTTPYPRVSSTSTPQFTQIFTDNTSNRIKSTEILTGPPLPSIQSPQPSQTPQPSRDKFRNDYHYSIDNSVALSQQIPQGPAKNSAPNEVYWQYDSSRFPGRQAQPQTFSEQPFVAPQENIATTKQASRGRVHFNSQPVTTEDAASFLITASPILTQPPRETQTRSKSATGTVRQPGLELVDSNSFRTHSTNVPVDYESGFSPSQTFETQRGKGFRTNQQPQEFSTIAQTFPSSTLPPRTFPSSTLPPRIETFRKEPTIEYSTGTDRFAPPQTTSPRIITFSSTETVNSNTASLPSAPDNSLTTVYGPGLTDKAAHDLYAIYQQTQNEETVKNTIVQDDRTTIIDEPVNTFVQTNPPTSVYTIVPQTTLTTTTTTTVAPTTTTTTTTTPPPPPPSTTTANVQSSPLPGRGRFRGTGINRNRISTEAPQAADSAGESSEKPRQRFQPSSRREPGHRISAYGRRGSTSTSTTGPEGDSSTASSNVETSTKSHLFVPSSRTRFRSSTQRTEGDSQSTISPGPRPNFADRYSRRRPGLRTTTTASPEQAEQEGGSVRQDTNNSNVESSSSSDQQSTTFRSIRNRFNNNRPQALRPGAKLNFSSRGKFGSPSSSTPPPVPLDADTSGSADAPVEQRKEETEHPVSLDAIGDTTLSSITSTTVNTPHPDPLSRLKHRSKLRVSDKGGHAKINAQQANSTAILHQNRRNLVHNLLPRKKLSTSTEAAEAAEREEKAEHAAKPVTEESHDEAPSPRSDTEVSESQSPAEASSTTESRLSSLIASRRNSLAARRPGTFSRSNKPQTTEES